MDCTNIELKIEAPNQRHRYHLNKFRIKFTVFNFLDNKLINGSMAYHSIIMILTIFIFAASVLTSFPSYDIRRYYGYYILELIVLVIYFIEFVLRLWSCNVLEVYREKGRLLYMKSSHMIIDLCIFATALPVLSLFLLGVKSRWLILIYNLSEVFRLFRFEVFRSSISLFFRVLRRHRSALLTGYVCAVLLILFSAFLLCIIENALNNAEFTEITDSVYFIIISFLTIGYGDKIPTSISSKIIVCITAMVGIAFAAVPSGIIGSGFALQVQNKEKKRSVQKQIRPAQILIQRAARNYLYHIGFQITIQADLIHGMANKKNRTYITDLLKNNLAHSRSSSQPKELLPLDNDMQNQPSLNSQKSNQGYLFVKLRKFRRSSGHAPMEDERVQGCFFLVGKVIRFLQMRVAARKIRTLRSPSGVEETLEDISIEQKRISFYLQDLNAKIRPIPTVSDQTHGRSLRSPNKDDTLRSMPNITMIDASVSEVNFEISKIYRKIDSLETSLKHIIELLENKKS